MNILLCNWQSVINSIPSLCWGIIVLIAIYLILKYVIQPWMKNCHERKMKEEIHNREKEWAIIKEIKANSEETIKKKMEDLTNEINTLENKLAIEKDRSKELIKHLEECKNHLNIIMTNLKK